MVNLIVARSCPPAIGQDAFLGLAGRFVDCFSPPAPRNALLLAFLTSAGAYFGRRQCTRWGGHQLWPNLFSLLVGHGAHAALFAVQEFFEWFRPHPVIVRSGLNSGQALVFQIRDALRRSDKVYTDRGADPKWRPTVVDTGTAERRLIIAQPSLARALARRTGAARSLEEVLADSFHGRDLAHFMSFRDGGFLRSTEPHVVVAAACPREDLVELPREFGSLCLVAAEVRGSVFERLPPADDKLTEVLMEFGELCPDGSPSEVTLAPAAAEIFEREVSRAVLGDREAAALKLLKLGLIYAQLHSSDRIVAEHASAAVAVLRYSLLTLQHLTAGVRIDRVVGAIEATLRRCPHGLTRTRINRGLNGRAKSAVIDAALDELARSGRARREFHRTPGRSAEWWYPEGETA